MDTLNSLLPIKERLDKLKKRIQESDFLEGKGLSNEVNIHICCYKPEEEMIVRHFTEQLIGDQSLKCQITEYNLYHTFLEICDEKRITSSISSMLLWVTKSESIFSFLFHSSLSSCAFS